MSDILGLIDHAIEDWAVSTDAMRWAPDGDVTPVDRPPITLEYPQSGGTLFVGGPLHGQVLRTPDDATWIVASTPGPQAWCIEGGSLDALPDIPLIRYHRRQVHDADHELFTVYAVNGADNTMLRSAIAAAT